MSKTKKSLVLSCLSMLLCATMLIGSTFAWFTDNASTSVNTIQAGTLDIDVQYTQDGENWSALDNATDLFADALWEPGHTRVVALKVTNNGSLALKYQMGMNIVSETEGTNVYGDNFKLSDYLEVSTLAQQANDSMGIGDITLSLAFQGENAVGYEYTNKLGEVKREAQLFSGDSHYLIIKVDMPETVSNEANAQPVKAASIQFGINILATQLNSESDSFGNSYDADAVYPDIVSNQTEANDAITNAADREVTLTIAANKRITLDSGIANGDGKSRDVTFVGDGSQKVDVVEKSVSAEGGNLNYQRGSAFTFENVTIQAGEGNFDGIVCDELTYKNCTIRGKLTLYGKATFVNCTFENNMADQYSIWTWGGTDVTFENCTFNTNGKAILLYGQGTAEKPTNLVVNNCTFKDRNNGVAGKAAIEIGDDYNATYALTVNNTTVNGFANGLNTNSKLWANKNSMPQDRLNVVIDGVDVY